MKTVEDIQTMDYQRYSEYLSDNPGFKEIGLYNELDIAVEMAVQIDEVPGKFAYPENTETEIIRMVTEEPTKWSSTHTIDGYVVVAVFENKRGSNVNPLLNNGKTTGKRRFNGGARKVRLSR